MSVQVSYKKQLVFGICLLLCLVIVVEIGARGYEYFFQDCNLEHAETLNEYDYFLKRQICYDQQNVIYSNQPVLSITPNQHFSTIDINNLGFRGEDISKSKSNDEYRIVMIGGSTVFGTGLSSNLETLPNELQKEIDSEFRNVEVINAGISRIASFEELYHVKNNIMPLSPDMLIIYNGVNDVWNKRDSDPILVESEEEKIGLKDFQKFFRTPVLAYRNIIVPIFNEDSGKDFIDVSDGTKDISSNVASLWSKHVDEMCQISKQHNVETIIIIQPTLLHGKKPLTDYEQTIFSENDYWKRTFTLFSEEMESLDNCSLALDFSDVFYSTKEGVYFDTVHVNNLGNSIIADKIYDEILPLIDRKFEK